MDIFDIGARVKGKPGTDDANKTGTIVDKERWIDGSYKLVNILYVKWDGEAEKNPKNEGELDIA